MLPLDIDSTMGSKRESRRVLKKTPHLPSCASAVTQSFWPASTAVAVGLAAVAAVLMWQWDWTVVKSFVVDTRAHQPRASVAGEWAHSSRVAQLLFVVLELDAHH